MTRVRFGKLGKGRPNPYVDRLGAKGRAELIRWWQEVTTGVRVLPADVAREFPDTESTVEALRLVIKLREVKPRAVRAPARKKSRSKRRSGTG
jgi:hypothetical protein